LQDVDTPSRVEKGGGIWASPKDHGPSSSSRQIAAVSHEAIAIEMQKSLKKGKTKKEKHVPQHYQYS
jgi:hypothetical protein